MRSLRGADDRGAPGTLSCAYPHERDINPIGRRPTHHSGDKHRIFAHAPDRRLSASRLKGARRTSSLNSHSRRDNLPTIASEGAGPRRNVFADFFLNANTRRDDSVTRRANFESRSAPDINAS